MIQRAIGRYCYLGCLCALLAGCAGRITVADHYTFYRNLSLQIGAGPAQPAADYADNASGYYADEGNLMLQVSAFESLAILRVSPMPPDTTGKPAQYVEIGPSTGGASVVGATATVGQTRFSIPDTLWGKAVPKDINQNKLYWKKAFKFNVQWGDTVLSGECEMLRFIHTESTTLAMGIRGPASRQF